MVRKSKAEGQADGHNKQKHVFKMGKHVHVSKKKSCVLIMKQLKSAYN